jgi:hypothetical protein
MEQIYDEDDYVKHFYDVLPAFKDERYIQVDGKPLFLVYAPSSIPDTTVFIDLWQKLSIQNGLNGIYFVGFQQSIDNSKISILNLLARSFESVANKYQQVLNMGFDAVYSVGMWRAEAHTRSFKEIVYRLFMRKLFGIDVLSKCKQSEINKYLYTEEDKWENVHPVLLPNWDRSPRSGKLARIYIESNPVLFRQQIAQALKLLEHKQAEHKILFLKSWNEWAEGNYVEPDLKFGKGYLNVLKEMLVE